MPSADERENLNLGNFSLQSGRSTVDFLVFFLQASVANAVHTLATHTVLHEVLVNCGAIKAICRYTDLGFS